MIDSVDFRCEGRRIEMGVFDENGENLATRPLTREEAVTMRDTLNAVLAEQERAYQPRQEALL